MKGRRRFGAGVPPPAGFDADAVFSQAVQWHQRWQMFEGVWTPGRNPVEFLCHKCMLPDDLEGARVLDVGAFNCCFSFECERRGADEVVALDLQDPAELGYTAIRHAIGSERVRFVNGSAYALNEAELGTFDVVLFFGVLYHLRYPLLALDQLRKVTRGTLYLETFVIDHRFVHRGKDFQKLASLHRVLPDVPLWQFYPGDELGNDFSNWFGPNIRAVLDGLTSAGFTARCVATWGDRAAFQAAPADAQELSRSYEGMSDLVRRQMGLAEG